MLGLVTAVLFFLVTSALAAPAGARFSVLDAMQPLRPIIPRLLIAVSAVILLSVATGFTALLAVVTTMPILCVIQMCRRPQTARQIAQTFWHLQKGSGDELVIISTSMVIASLAADTTSLSVMLDGLFGKGPCDMANDLGPACIGLASFCLGCSSGDFRSSLAGLFCAILNCF